MNKTRRTLIQGSMLTIPALSFAQTRVDEVKWPESVVRIMVGFTPGASVDTSARIVAEQLSVHLAKAVIVDNKAGASGTIAAEYVARSKPDGYTLMYCSPPTHTIGVFLYKDLHYDAQRDFTPISLVAMHPNILTVHPSVKANTLQELVEAIRKDSSQSFYAAVIAGSPHLACEAFQQRAKIKMNLVPYKGASQGIADVVGGTVPISFENAASVIGLVNAGKLKPIAVTSLERLAILPNVPTMSESGYPGFESEGWGGLVGPAGIPPAVTQRLSEQITSFLGTPAVRRKFDELGLRVANGGPAQFGKFLDEQRSFYKELITRINLKVE
ncbi:tripartite tricarboxylate transporter substrate binding protein [soil metagenome]